MSSKASALHSDQDWLPWTRLYISCAHLKGLLVFDNVKVEQLVECGHACTIGTLLQVKDKKTIEKKSKAEPAHC